MCFYDFEVFFAFKGWDCDFELNDDDCDSLASDRLYVPLVRLSTVGSRTFPVSDAAVWNDLPVYVTSAPLLAVFRQRLKTFLMLRQERNDYQQMIDGIMDRVVDSTNTITGYFALLMCPVVMQLV